MNIKFHKYYIAIFLLIMFLGLWGVSYFHSTGFTRFYLVVSVGLFLINLFCIFFVWNKQLRPWQVAILIIALGTVYNFILPACTVPDEDFHFVSAYKVSNCLINGTTLEEQNTKIFMRQDIKDSLTLEYHGGELADYYRNFLSRKIAPEFYYKDTDLVRNSPMYYQYIYPGIIISLCRLLKLGAQLLLFTGREFNLILFTLLIYISLKVCPQISTSISVLALFPMTLVEAASYSYDSIIIPAIFLLLSLIINCIKGNDPLTFKVILFISLLFVFVVPIKLVYFPIVLLLFFIKSSGFKNVWHKYLWIALICVASICIMIIAHGEFVRFYFTKDWHPVSTEEYQQYEAEYASSDDLDSFNAMVVHIWNVTDIKSEPLEFVGVMFRSIFDTSDQLFANIVGYYFGWFAYKIPISLIIIFPVLFAISTGINDIIVTGFRERLMYLIVIVSSFFLIMLSMLLAETDYGHPTIIGVQGRYFIPLVPLAALILKNDLICNKDGLPSKLISISAMSNSIVLLYLLKEVLA